MKSQNDNLATRLVSALTKLTPYRTRLLLILAVTFLAAGIIVQLVFIALLPHLPNTLVVDTSSPRAPVSGPVDVAANSIVMYGWISIVAIAFLTFIAALCARVHMQKILLPCVILAYLGSSMLIGRLIGIAISNYFSLGQTMYEYLFTVLVFGIGFWTYVGLIKKEPTIPQSKA